MTDPYPDLELDLDPVDDLTLMDTDPSVLPSHSDDEDEIRFAPGSEEYRKARKRRQNRESAARTRARQKADYLALDREIEKLSQENRRLMLENQSLRTENEILNKELSFYVSLMEKTTCQSVGGGKGLLGTTALAVVLCMCFVLGTGEEVAVGSGRHLLALGYSEVGKIPRALGLAVVCLAFVWLNRLFPTRDAKSKNLV